MTHFASLRHYVDIAFGTSPAGISPANHAAYARSSSAVQGRLLRAVHGFILASARRGGEALAVSFPAYVHAPWRSETEDGEILLNGWRSNLGHILRIFGSEQPLISLLSGDFERNGRRISDLLTQVPGLAENFTIKDIADTPRKASLAANFHRSRSADRSASIAVLLQRHERFKQHLIANGKQPDMALLNRRFEFERQRLLNQTDEQANLPFAEVASSAGKMPFRLMIERSSAEADSIHWTETPVSSYGIGGPVPIF